MYGNVWYIYLHLVDFYSKCREIYHTWMVRVRSIFPQKTHGKTWVAGATRLSGDRAGDTVRVKCLLKNPNVGGSMGMKGQKPSNQKDASKKCDFINDLFFLEPG